MTDRINKQLLLAKFLKERGADKEVINLILNRVIDEITNQDLGIPTGPIEFCETDTELKLCNKHNDFSMSYNIIDKIIS